MTEDGLRRTDYEGRITEDGLRIKEDGEPMVEW